MSLRRATMQGSTLYAPWRWLSTVIGAQVLCLAVPLLAASADSVPEPIQIEQVEIGFNGRYKLGYWTPLTVGIRGIPPGGEAQLEVTVPDGEGVPSTVTAAVASIEPTAGAADGSSAIARLYVKIGRDTGEMTLLVKQQDRMLARRVLDLSGGDLPSAMTPRQFLVLTLGRTEHLTRTLAEHPEFRAAGGEIAEIVDGNQLPDQWYGYEGVDAVVIAGAAADMVRHRARIAALDRWLRRGGTVLFTVGAKASQWFAGDRPWNTWLPGKPGPVVSLANAGSLERLSGVDVPLESVTEGDPLRLDAARLTEVTGNVLLSAGPQAGDIPLVVQGVHGFGSVTFVAVDLDGQLFGRWSGTSPLALELLFPKDSRRLLRAQSGPLGEVTHAGYDDLSGQLRAALDQFQEQGVTLMPFGVFFLLVVTYIALVGPGDYFFVKRLLRRMEATWITLPVLIVATCGGAYLLAASMKGDQLHMNQVDVVDYDLAGGARRATSWFTIYSPEGRAYDLSLRAQSTMPSAAGETADGTSKPGGDDVLLSWFGLPGKALGGMQSRSVPTLGGWTYRFAQDLDALWSVPIPVWSTKSFVARWMPGADSPVVGQLRSAGGGVEGLLSGTLTNRSGLRLRDCTLVTRRWVYPLGDLIPGAKVRVSEKLAPRIAESHLARRREVAEEYDRYDTDVERILELMSFYEAAGGRQYCRLDHRYEQRISLMNQLRAGRAVFVGLSSNSVAVVQNAGSPLAATPRGRTAIYHVVLPIGAEQVSD